jgi:hypothetical protein
MIYDEIYNLKQYIVSTVKVNAVIGEPDLSPDEYPIIRISFNEEGLISFHNTKTSVIDMPISLRIIVTKGQEVKAFKILDNLILKVNQFLDQKGHQLEGTVSPEYVDETKTYEINVLFNIKLLLQDTT